MKEVIRNQVSQRMPKMGRAVPERAAVWEASALISTVIFGRSMKRGRESRRLARRSDMASPVISCQ